MNNVLPCCRRASQHVLAPRMLRPFCGVQGTRSQNPSSGQYSAAYSNSHLMEPSLADLPEASQQQPPKGAPMHAAHAPDSPSASENTDFMSVVSGSFATSITGDSVISNNPFQGNVNPFALGVVNPLFGGTASSQAGSDAPLGRQSPQPAPLSPGGSLSTGTTPRHGTAPADGASGVGGADTGGKGKQAAEDPWAAIRGM